MPLHWNRRTEYGNIENLAEDKYRILSALNVIAMECFSVVLAIIVGHDEHDQRDIPFRKPLNMPQ